jgi:hypothetical protein
MDHEIARNANQDGKADRLQARAICSFFELRRIFQQTIDDID